MSDRIECPNCGYQNSSTRVTCKSCKTNLREAFDNEGQQMLPKATNKSLFRFVIWASAGGISLIIVAFLLTSMADTFGTDVSRIRPIALMGIPILIAKGTNEFLKSRGWH